MRKDDKKKQLKFVCEECGYESTSWLGRCPTCEKFNTFVEEIKIIHSTIVREPSEYNNPILLKECDIKKEGRILTQFDELNRVLGGGIVPGSLILIGGEPGIGKSTLLLQVANQMSNEVNTCIYISGEESPAQIKLRAQRIIPTLSDNLYILPETNIEYILESIKKINPRLIIVDSIQTLYHKDIPSSAGSVAQVRECTNCIMRVAKEEKIPTFIIGHVTKEGVIAGPRVLEHIVDTVLYFEGDRNINYRMLRAVKNRFGPTSELGVFEMTEKGLKDVTNPSEIFLKEKAEKNISGSCVIATVEGTRAILLEVQALVTPCNFGIPRRQTIGLDYNRVSLILAVLEKVIGFNISNYDVYVNLPGGLKITEPAADLGIALSVASSIKNKPLKEDMLIVGEIGLTGEIRSIPQVKKRLKEALKVGFTSAIIPASCLTEDLKELGLKIYPAKVLKEALKESIINS